MVYGIMDEPPADRRRRLEGEGRWNESQALKAQLLSEGFTPGEADARVRREFAASGMSDLLVESGVAGLTEEVASSEAIDPDDSVPELDLGDPDIRRDAYWAYNNIGRGGVKRKDAPSQGAWNMFRQFGRNDKTTTDFLEKIAQPMLKSEPKGERYHDDNRELIALAERYRAQKSAELAEEGEEGRCRHCGHLRE